MAQLTEEAAASHPAVVFFHGTGGSGANIMRNTAIIRASTANNYVVVAAEGLIR